MDRYSTEGNIEDDYEHGGQVLIRDGNGRIARLITILMALQAGYPAPDFAFPINKNRRMYLTAVTKGYAQNYKLLAAVIQEAIERSKKLLTN